MEQYLLSAFVIALGINLVMFLVAFRLKTDKLTDASYAVTFIVVTIFGLLSQPLTLYRVLLATMVLAWALRLGGFLLYRIRYIGRDRRFDTMRGDFKKFGKFWVGQGLTVWILMLPALFALHTHRAVVSHVVLVGLALWLFGVSVEAIADMQKYRYTKDPSNKGLWIQTGLWAYSRHPNYFGEIVAWTGVWVVAATAITRVEALITLVSPALITALLLFMSGIPILEKLGDKRWGGHAAYQDYKRRTSILLLLPKRHS